jgi:hypothetical protein
MKYLSVILLMIATSVVMLAQPKIWDVGSLNNVSADLNSDVVKLLLRDAEKELVKTLITVVDKQMTPPSGDKHDYMSMGRYWWPNPATTDGLPYIRKDGLSNPEIEKLDRLPLAQMTRGIKSLSLAYYISKDEKYAAKAVENLRKWFLDKSTRMNPHLNYGQTVPGHNNGMGRGFGIIDTYSFVEMLEGVELLKSSKKFSKKDQQGLHDWFSAYLDWMLTSPIGKEEFDAPNNHGTAFDVQVVRYALFVGKEDIARKYLDEFPVRRLFAQIEPDGSQPLELARTTAFGYSVFNLDHIIDLCRIGKTLGYDLLQAQSADGRSFIKAIEFLLPFAGKTVADFPYQQIRDWDKVQQEFAILLYRVDKLLTKPVYGAYYSRFVGSKVRNINLIIY